MIYTMQKHTSASSFSEFVSASVRIFLTFRSRDKLSRILERTVLSIYFFSHNKSDARWLRSKEAHNKLSFLQKL